MSMSPCNMKITITIDDLDKPDEDPVKVVDQMEINGIDYNLGRSVTPQRRQGVIEPVGISTGPWMGRFEFMEKKL